MAGGAVPDESDDAGAVVATEDTSLLGNTTTTKTTASTCSKARAGDGEDKSIARLRLWWGVCYAAAMGVCGIVLVALGSTLSSLAADCGTTSTKVGTVFIARGIGAVTGALSSARLYAPPRRGNLVMVVVLVALAAILLVMPFVRSTWVLHLTWFALGACTATLDTGCQIMTRKVHGVHAGPWLGANTVSFAIAGAFVPLIELVTGKLFAQYATLATIAIVNAAALFASPVDPEQIVDRLPPRLAVAATDKTRHFVNAADKATRSPRKQSTSAFVKRYPLELIFGATVFWLIGGKVDTTSYVATYVKITHIVAEKQASVALLVLWIAIGVGRLVGLRDQIALKQRPTRAIYLHLTAWLAAGTLGMLVACLFSKKKWAFWVGLALYGVGNGPCVGYVYDLVNRMTVASEMGMSIVMFGLNLGASLIPYLTTVVWDHTAAGAETLIYITLLSMFIPMPLLLLSATVGNVAVRDDDDDGSSSSSLKEGLLASQHHLTPQKATEVLLGDEEDDVDAAEERA